MPWPSGRRRPYDSAWAQVVRLVKARSNGVCENPSHVPLCDGLAVEVDHITPWSLGGQSTPLNARHLSRQCHAAKTQAEAQQAAIVKRERGYRPPESHPFDSL